MSLQHLASTSAPSMTTLVMLNSSHVRLYINNIACQTGDGNLDDFFHENQPSLSAPGKLNLGTNEE